MTWLANLSVHDAGTLAVVVTVLVLVGWGVVDEWVGRR